MARVGQEQKVITKAGDHLADRDIDALASEAEAGYQLDSSQWIKVGRPPLGRSRGESPRIGFRATKNLYDAAQSQARAEGLTVSALAREAIEQYLASSSRQTRRPSGRTPSVRKRGMQQTSSKPTG